MNSGSSEILINMDQDDPNKLPKEQKWSGEEVAKHNNDKDCWLVSSSLLFCLG